MRAILNWITIGWAALLLSSLVSMMAVFMGSGSDDLGALLSFQVIMIPLGLLALLFYWRHASHHEQGVPGAVLLWRHMPGWLVFIVLSAASLTLIAELTMVLITVHAEEPRPWLEHVPALSALTSALALAFGYASLQIGAQR